MNKRIILRILGSLLILEPLMMLPSLLISLYKGEDDSLAFLIVIGISAFLGLLLMQVKAKQKMIKVKEGLAIVTFGWIVFSVIGCLPFIISGYIPNFIDALFESVSGFTTTGASILTNIEVLPHGLLFWRSFTHWIGGMGILVFTVALLPKFGIGGFQIFKAESPGPESEKIVPKITSTAKILYLTYILLTLLEILFLQLAGLSAYDACIQTFGTMGTGGFSNKNMSIAAFDSSAVHIIITVFMILAGANFSLYYCIQKKKWASLLHDSELRVYLGIILIASAVVAVNIGQNYSSAPLALRDAFFQVSSIITTTGYMTVDFDQWPTFSKVILFLLMFVGGSAGSTGGSIKVIRIIVVTKLITRELSRIYHPRAVIPIKVGKKALPSSTVNSITSFFVLYMLLFVVGVILISLNGFDFETTITSVAATLGNVGPGFSMVGPIRNYSEFNGLSKVVFTILMLLGRLELFTMVALIAPRAWIKELMRR